MSFPESRKGPAVGQARPVYPVVAAIVERETFLLAFAIQKITDQLPHKTFLFLWFHEFVGYLKHKKPTTLAAFSEAFNDFVKTVISIERTVAGVVQAGKSKTFQTLTDLKTIGYILSEVATSNKLSLTDHQLHTLIHHALPGSAPAESQAEAVDIVHSFLTETAAIRVACNAASYEDQRFALLLANLYALLRQAVELKEYNPTATMQGKGEDQNAARWAAFRTLEAKLLGADSAGAVGMTKHLLTWLTSNTAVKAVPLEHQVKFSALKEAYDARGADEWPFQPRAILDAAWDPSLFASSRIETAGTRKGTTDLETALLQNKTTGFEDDFTINMELGFAEMAAWIDLANESLSTADKLCARVRPLKTSGAAEVPTANPEIHPGNQFSGLSELPGYPVNPSYRGFNVVLASKRPLRQMGISPIMMTTLARLQEAVKDMVVPIRIRSDFLSGEQQKVFGAAPMVEPVFGDIEEGGEGLTANLRNLEEMSGYVEGYLARRFAELAKASIRYDAKTNTATVAVTMLLRGFAESWRHIGQLTFVAGNETVIIKPLCGHWYHGLKFDKGLFGPDIDLGSGQTPEGVAWSWKLKPFTSVPDCAKLAAMPSHLARITFKETEPTQPLIRWFRREGEPGKATGLAITGWRRGDGKLADIVIVAAASSGTQYQFFPDIVDDRAFAVAPYNAGVMVTDPPSPEPWDTMFLKDTFATVYT